MGDAGSASSVVTLLEARKPALPAYARYIYSILTAAARPHMVNLEPAGKVHLSQTDNLAQALLQEGDEPSSLAEVAYRQMKVRIITLQMRPGELMKDSELQAALGLGRTPIREAVNRLVADGLVEMRARRGAFVSGLNLTDFGRLYEVRAHLEGLAARLAAERANAEDEQLGKWHEELASSDPAGLDYMELLAIDHRWHQFVYGLARNHYLQQDLNRYLNLSIRSILAVSERSGFPLADLLGAVQEFHDLYSAICLHDSERAERAARHHSTLIEMMVRDSA
jgi:DNA-binding GntR family transcriptional regulator